MAKNLKTVLGAAAALVVGYVGGAYIGLPNTNSELNGGNTAKLAGSADRLASLQDKLKNDKEALATTTNALNVMSTRTAAFAELVNASIEASSKIPELKSITEQLQGVKDLANNASQASKTATVSLSNLLADKTEENTPAYDQAAQYALMSYLMVENSEVAGKDFMNAVDYYFHESGETTDSKLAAVRDLWASYFAGDAQLKGTKANATTNILGKKELETALNADAGLKSISKLNNTVAQQAKNVKEAFSAPDKLAGAIMDDPVYYGMK